jgi:hypothetical protein
MPRSSSILAAPVSCRSNPHFAARARFRPRPCGAAPPKQQCSAPASSTGVIAGRRGGGRSHVPVQVRFEICFLSLGLFCFNLMKIQIWRMLLWWLFLVMYYSSIPLNALQSNSVQQLRFEKSNLYEPVFFLISFCVRFLQIFVLLIPI